MLEQLRNIKRRFDTRWKFYKALQNPTKVLELGCGKGPNCIEIKSIFPNCEIHIQLAHEIYRVLKPNGVVYVEAPDWKTILVPSIGFRREQHHPFNFYDDISHVKPWTKHGLFEYLYSICKLRSVRVGTVRNWVRVTFDPFAIVLTGREGML